MNKYHFYKLIFILSIINIFYSYFIPFSIISGAVHDDFLFFRIGESISQYHWLGDFQNTTLIKGFVFPLFIGMSIFFNIPLRVLESVLVCGSALYFISLLRYTKISENLLILLYGLIIFYPLQYGSVDFRLLRDMIYPQQLLILFTASFFILYYSKLTNIIIKKIKPA